MDDASTFIPYARQDENVMFTWMYIVHDEIAHEG
jgi:hypothetical protein